MKRWILKHRKYVNFEIWSYEFHLVLKVISGTFKQIYFGVSKYRLLFFKIFLIYEKCDFLYFLKFPKMHRMQIRAFPFWKVAPTALRPLRIVELEICWPVAGRILLYDPKTAFTSRVQVGNRISAPMSYLTFSNQINR